MTFEPNALFIKEEMESDALIATNQKSATGTNILFVTVNNNQNMTLQSMQYSYVTDDQRQAINTMYEDIGNTYTVDSLDSGSDEVAFKYDEAPIFTETFEGSCLFTATIYLYKI